MARTWYQISDGPAPWADASSMSYTVSTSINFSPGTSTSSNSVIYYSKGGHTQSGQTGALGDTTFPYSPSSFGGATAYGLFSYVSGMLSAQTINSAGRTITAAFTGTATRSVDDQFQTRNYITATSGGRTASSSHYETLINNRESGSTTDTYSSSATYLLATAGVTTSYLTSSYASGYNTTSSYSSDSSYPVSTALTSTTSTATSDTITYLSTILDTSSYTSADLTYLTRVGSSWVAQTTSYLPLYQYLIPIISADTQEFLKIQTATGSLGVSGLNDLLGASFTQTTLSSAFYTSTITAPGPGGISSTPTRTTTGVILTYSTATITVSTGTNITVTQQFFDGWIGGTATSSRVLFGATSRTSSIQMGATATASGTKTADRSLTGYQSFGLTSFLSETITGLNPTGGSAVYAVVKSYAAPQWFTYVSWEGNIGETVTRYRSPSTPFGYSGAGTADLNRIQRAGGYQSPHDMGSAGAQGKSVSAASSFYIGAYNLRTGSPPDLRSPFLTYGSTAETSDSSYSFSFGATNCSVTALRTDTSSSTITTFTASISVAGAADSFNSNSPAGQTSSRTVAGGAHAWTGGQQNATLGGGYGWRYTIGDSLGTTSFIETRTVSIATTALGSSIIAAETFKAGVPSPLLAAGLPNVLTFAYSAP